MSLLIGANLVDRIYVCADTRLSRILQDGGKESYERIHDNQLKFVPTKNNIVVGCVGSPALGTHLYKKIVGLLEPGIYIRELRRILSEQETELKLWINDYLVTPPVTDYKHARCVLLFAGQNSTVKRKVSGERLHALFKSYQNSRPKLETLFGGKPLDQFTSEDSRRLLSEMMNRRTGIKEVIVAGIRKLVGPSREIEISSPDQLIFTLKVDCSNAPKIISFENFEWGETAVYGTNHDSTMLPKTFFGDLDFNMNSGDVRKDLIPFVAEINEKFSTTIGGSITNMILKDGNIFCMTQELFRMKVGENKPEVLYHTDFINGKLHHLNNGVWSKLIPFTESQKLPVAEALLIE